MTQWNGPATRDVRVQALVVVLVSAWLSTVEAAAPQPVDPDRSTVVVHVGKSGIFRAFADDHEIRGPATRGFVDEDAGTVEILIDARRLEVLDPKLSPKDRSDVQARMLGADVLDVSRFPEIRFTSAVARDTGEGGTLRGQLTLHGQTRQVTVSVTKQAGHYKGSARLKQTEFGITPVTVAGGAVKVKDEITIDVDIVTRAGE